MKLIFEIPENTQSVTVTIDGHPTASFKSKEDMLINPVLESLEGKAMEDNADFSNCDGFIEHFLGFATPLPALSAPLKRQVAKHSANANEFVLRYHLYSCIQHAVRKMPVVSAVNIDGDPGKRLDNEKRKDNWLRDNRIDFDVQLNDAWYRNSGFDKGHMSRREDADWGNTAGEAYRNAQMTCMHTNACPQVGDLNRTGLWGDLEKIILEKGAALETGKAAKICVYNGPVFVPTDPVYKGIQVPLRFFKIVVWLNARKEKKTTAFILSQEDLVSDIRFEELHFDEEFKEHQCSIAYLENVTGLIFEGIRDWDTFQPETTGKRVKRINKSTLDTMIEKNS